MLISEFKTTLDALNQSVHQLKPVLFSPEDIFIGHPGRPFLVGNEASEEAFNFISEFYYREGERDGRFTPILLGGISLSEQGISKIAEVNRIKEQLQECILNIKQSLKGRDGRALSHSGSAKAFRTLMNEIGYGRLSIKQCTRKIPILEEQLKSIRFSFSTGGKSLTRKSPQEALQILEKSGYMSAKSQIEREVLERMNPETQLAQVQRLAGYFKANVVFSCGERKTIPSSVPLVYSNPTGEKVIRQVLLPADQPRPGVTRKRRSDQKVSQLPFISSIRIHTYERQ